MGIGELAGIGAAVLWAFASLLYAETRLSAWAMNFSKIVVATVILFVQMVLIALWNGEPLLTAPPSAWFWLGLSGLVGLTIGDTCYFRSLQILGARRCLIVTTTAPVFAALLGWVWLGETLLVISLVGIGLTVTGIMWVIREGDSADESPGHFPGTHRAGLAFGVAAAVCQAVGAVATKLGMEHIGALEATFVRMLLAGIFVALATAGRRQLRRIVAQSLNPEVLRRLLPAILCGTWLGVWFSQVAFKFTSVGIAQTLLATCPLFAIPLIRMRYGTRITLPAVAGASIAVLGICLIVLPGSPAPAEAPSSEPVRAASGRTVQTSQPPVAPRRIDVRWPAAPSGERVHENSGRSKL